MTSCAPHCPAPCNQRGYDYGADGTNGVIDPNQVVFKTSSLAVLRAKERGCTTAGDDSVVVSGAILILQSAYRMWKNGQLCDVLISTKEKELRAHKVVLAAYSDPLAERFQDFPPGAEVSLDFKDFSSETMMMMLNFMYTTDININEDNVGELMHCALEMEVPSLIQLCYDFLSHFNSDNCLHFYSIAIKYGLNDLKQKILDYIKSHIAEIENGNAFTKMDYDTFVIVAGDEDFFASELDAFYAMVKWIDHQPNARLQYAPIILRTIKLYCIPAELLATEVEPVTEVFNFKECFLQLFNAFKYLALRAIGSQLAQQMYADTSSRKAAQTLFPPAFFAAGSSGGNMVPAATTHSNKYHEFRQRSQSIALTNPRTPTPAPSRAPTNLQ